MSERPTVSLHLEQNSLIIPVDRDHLGSFIGGLLGRPQTIENSFGGPFNLDKRDIEDVFHLVDQRIKQQNRAELVQFAVKIIYEDNSSVLLNSLDDFLHYREVRPQVSVDALLSWTYLIQFEDQQIPERQVIELRISTSGFEPWDIIPFLIRKRLRALKRNFYLTIQHTARSWGVDIEHLLIGRIQSWIIQEPWVKRFIYNNSEWFGILIGLFLISFIYLGASSALEPTIEAFRIIGEKALAGSLEDRVNFLVETAINNPIKKRDDIINFVIPISWVIAFIVGFVITILGDNPPTSYLVLSDAAKKKREELLKRRTRHWGYFIASGLATTIAGVLSRYLFMIFFGKSVP